MIISNFLSDRMFIVLSVNHELSKYIFENEYLLDMIIST